MALTPRPCPICGADPVVRGEQLHGIHPVVRRWRISCCKDSRGIHSVYAAGKTRAAATELWNGCDIQVSEWKPKPKRKR